jgi:acetylglutamate kinase
VLGRVGGPPRVDSDRLLSLLAQRVMPVVAPVSLGVDGDPVNVNADTVAHALAVAVQAASLEFVSDVPGVLLEGDEVAGRLSAAEAQRLLAGSAIRGGMIPKLQAALAAVDAGVGRVRIGDLDAMNENTATEIVA